MVRRWRSRLRAVALHHSGKQVRFSSWIVTTAANVTSVARTIFLPFSESTDGAAIGALAIMPAHLDNTLRLTVRTSAFPPHLAHFKNHNRVDCHSVRERPQHNGAALQHNLDSIFADLGAAHHPDALKLAAM